jgi:hypothetical protein
MTPPTTPQQAAKGVLEAAEWLLAVLREENRALGERRAGVIRAGISDKIAAAGAYEQAVRRMADLGEAAAGLDPSLRARLKTASERLSASAEDNHRRLTVARAAQRRLIDHIVDAIKALAPGTATYGRDGATGRGPARKAPPVAVSLNRTL